MDTRAAFRGASVSRVSSPERGLAPRASGCRQYRSPDTVNSIFSALPCLGGDVAISGILIICVQRGGAMGISTLYTTALLLSPQQSVHRYYNIDLTTFLRRQNRDLSSSWPRWCPSFPTSTLPLPFRLTQVPTALEAMRSRFL